MTEGKGHSTHRGHACSFSSPSTGAELRAYVPTPAHGKCAEARGVPPEPPTPTLPRGAGKGVPLPFLRRRKKKEDSLRGVFTSGLRPDPHSARNGIPRAPCIYPTSRS